jgi:hypothetical protein
VDAIATGFVIGWWSDLSGCRHDGSRFVSDSVGSSGGCDITVTKDITTSASVRATVDELFGSSQSEASCHEALSVRSIVLMGSDWQATCGSDVLFERASCMRRATLGLCSCNVDESGHLDEMHDLVGVFMVKASDVQAAVVENTGCYDIPEEDMAEPWFVEIERDMCRVLADIIICAVGAWAHLHTRVVLASLHLRERRRDDVTRVYPHAHVMYERKEGDDENCMQDELHNVIIGMCDWESIYMVSEMDNKRKGVIGLAKGVVNDVVRSYERSHDGKRPPRVGVAEECDGMPIGSVTDGAGALGFNDVRGDDVDGA